MLIVVSGKKRSGKDTFYEIVKEFVGERYPYISCKKFAFAGKVKEYAETYFSVRESSDSYEKEKNRRILQGIGQMFREEISKDFWVDIVDQEVAQETSKYSLSIVTDARYVNEIKWAYRQPGAKVVRVERPSLFSLEDSHASETELDNFTFPSVLLNSGSIEDYKNEVISWIIPVLKELK